jgi:hypothetical protein
MTKPPKLRTLKDVYDQVPALNCKGYCSSGCTLIPLYPAEANAIRDAGLEVPSYNEAKGSCSALVEGRCTIYEHRPLICRLFGNVAPKMKCPYGCKPATLYLTDKQSKKLFEALTKLSGTNTGGAVVYHRGDALLTNPETTLKSFHLAKMSSNMKKSSLGKGE